MSKNDANSFAKCVYCRDPCQQSTTVCERCQKNSTKYGKPSTCQYCQLPAAFLGQVCQHCSNNEKRFGQPQQCQHCKLKAAFVKDKTQTNKKQLCRLCKIMYSRSVVVAEKHKTKRKNSLTKEEASTAVAPKKPHTGLTSISKVGSPTVQQANEALGEHILTVTKLKDDALNLQRQMQSKDQVIFEKDKKITELKADMLRMTREHRDRLGQIQKQHQVQVDHLQEKIHSLNRQIATLTKSSRPAVKKQEEKVFQ